MSPASSSIKLALVKREVKELTKARLLIVNAALRRSILDDKTALNVARVAK